MSALLTLNLVSNAASHSSFRPKRRSHYAPVNISICPPLKRESNASHFTSLSLSAAKKASTSKVKCASTPSFPRILITFSIESCLEPCPPKKNATAKKELTINNIFSSLKKISSTFHKILEEKGVIIPARCLCLALPAFPSNVPSDEEPDVSFDPPPSEHRHSCELHFLRAKMKTILMALMPQACLLAHRLLHNFILF